MVFSPTALHRNSCLLFQPAKNDVKLADEAKAAAELVNDILFKMNPADLGNDILETDTNVYDRDRYASAALSDASPLLPTSAMSRFESLYSSPSRGTMSSPTGSNSKSGGKREKSNSLAEVVEELYKKERGTPLIGTTGIDHKTTQGMPSILF